MENLRRNRISMLLSAHNMSQKELARATGLTESAISHYVKGDRVPRGVNLIKIAKALNTTTDDLLDFNEESQNLEEIKTLIARNASAMTLEQRQELIKILINVE